MADYSHLMGWYENQAEVEKTLSTMSKPYFCDYRDNIKGTGRGKKRLLHNYVVQVLGKYNVRTQAIGDCVSFGYAGGVDIVKCVQSILGSYGQWVAETCTEYIYGTSRVEIGGGQLGNGDGSNGSWAAAAVEKYGTLLRIKYGNTDLTQYSGQRAKNWGYRGVPDELEPIGKEHCIRTTSLVTTYEDACDLIYNGYPIAVCSNQGFSSVRDNNGFARPQGSWGHCMLVHGYDDSFSKPGVLIQNSWGPDWISGPKREDQPDGSFWCDAQTFQHMLNGQDSFALSNFDDYPPQDLDLRPF